MTNFQKREIEERSKSIKLQIEAIESIRTLREYFCKNKFSDLDEYIKILKHTLTEDTTNVNDSVITAFKSIITKDIKIIENYKNNFGFKRNCFKCEDLEKYIKNFYSNSEILLLTNSLYKSYKIIKIIYDSIYESLTDPMIINLNDSPEISNIPRESNSLQNFIDFDAEDSRSRKYFEDSD